MKRMTTAGALLVAAVVAAGCGSSPSSSSTGGHHGGQPAVSERTTSLGKVLVDAEGHTLYHLSADSRDKSKCTGACTAIWPPLLVTGTPSFGGLSGLSTFNRGGGKMQVAYHGEPLYTFSGDAKAGDTAGQGITDAWGHWTALVMSAAPGGGATSTSTSGGGYGY